MIHQPAYHAANIRDLNPDPRMRQAGVASVSVNYRNVSNPAAFGVEWTTQDTRHTLVNPRGTTALWLGMHHDGRWSRLDVLAPSRFGLSTPPRSFATFLTVVRAYVQA
jgi:hypothetical protein